jgi:hypothetical protein
MAQDQERDELHAAMEAAWERNAEPQPRDILKREHDRILKGHPRDVALEKWGPVLDRDVVIFASKSGRKGFKIESITPKRET